MIFTLSLPVILTVKSQICSSMYSCPELHMYQIWNFYGSAISRNWRHVTDRQTDRQSADTDMAA